MAHEIERLRLQNGVLTVLLLGGALFVGGCESAPEASPRPAASASATATAPTWRAGERYVYQLKLSSELELGAGKALQFDLRAAARLDVRQLGSGALEFLTVLQDVAFSSTDNDPQDQFTELAKEIARPYAFTLKAGSLEELAVPSEATPFASTIRRTIAAAFQIAPLPRLAGAQPWTAREFDGTGRYDAEYRALNGSVFEKRKLRYEPISLGKVGLGNLDAKLTPEVVSSKGAIHVRAGSSGVVERIEQHDELRTQLTATSPVRSTTDLVLAFTSVSRPASPVDFSAALVGTQRTQPAQPLVVGAAPTRYDETRIGDYTFESALRELEAHSKNPRRNELVQTVRGEPFEPKTLESREQSFARQGRAFGALTGLLRTRPSDVELAVRHVRSGSPAGRALLDGLSSAGTPVSQAALVTLLEDPRLSLSQRQAAAFSLARTARATPAAVDALLRHVDETDPLRMHALYGLGTICRRLRELGDAALSDRISDALIRALEAARAPAAQVTVLRGIANSGHPGAWPRVVPLLGHDSVKVRAAALDAVRLMPRTEVDTVVAQHLMDGEPKVQQAALDAASVREPTPVLVQELQRVAKASPVPATRTRAVRVLAHWLPKAPELRPTLEHLASHDDNEQVRGAAKLALGS